MRSRLMLLFSLVLVVTSAFIVSAPFAPAGDHDVVLAQEDGGGGGGTGGGGGQGDPEAETGTDAGQTEEVVEETGPPWTYQMAWITLALLVLMGIGLVGLYYRLVVQRRKSGA